MPAGWAELPEELLHAVFRYLSPEALVRGRAVCRWWRAAAQAHPTVGVIVARHHCRTIDTAAAALATLQWFRSVTTLTLGDGVPDDMQLAAVAMCPRLRALHLNSNIRSPALIAALRTRRRLRELRVRGCRMSAWFEHLPQIRTLRVPDTVSLLCTTAPLTPMSAVRTLDVSGAEFGGAAFYAPRIDARFPNLHVLILDNSTLSDDTVVGLGPLPKLRHVSIRRTRVTDAGLCLIAQLEGMRTIVAVGTMVTARCARRLAEGEWPPEIPSRLGLTRAPPRPIRVLLS